jgi:hypothetical protein
MVLQVDVGAILCRVHHVCVCVCVCVSAVFEDYCLSGENDGGIGKDQRRVEEEGTTMEGELAEFHPTLEFGATEIKVERI